MEEKRIACVFALIYHLSTERTWELVAPGWVDLQLYRDLHDGTTRLVGWEVANNTVVFNQAVSSACIYTPKGDTFHKFIGEGGAEETFGFAFSDEVAVGSAITFKEVCLAEIEGRPHIPRRLSVADRQLLRRGSQCSTPPQQQDSIGFGQKTMDERKECVRVPLPTNVSNFDMTKVKKPRRTATQVVKSFFGK